MKKNYKTIVSDYCKGKKLDTVESIKITDYAIKYQEKIETLSNAIQFIGAGDFRCKIIDNIYKYIKDNKDIEDDVIEDYLDRCTTAINAIDIYRDMALDSVYDGI